MTAVTEPTYRLREALRAMSAYTLEPRSAAHKLDQNEAATAWGHDFMRELAQRIARRDLRRYPDFEATRVRSAIAAFHGLAREQVLVGNGSNEMLMTAFATFVSPGTRVVIPTPSFALFEQLATIFGADTIRVPYDAARGELPVDELCALGDGSIVVIASPNNPAGATLQRGDLQRILDSGALVFFDRAYGEFAGETVPPVHERLITFSTFSKAWGLAGLRVGWIAATAENCVAIRKVKLPYNLNVASEEGVLLALERASEVDERVRVTVAERERLRVALQQIDGLTPFPSAANFITARVANAKETFDRLLAHDILVRDVSRTRGLENCLRFAVGTAEENDLLVAALRGAPVPSSQEPALPPRGARVTRTTKETSIALTLDVDGSAKTSIATPIGFLSHMLETIAKHARLDLTVDVRGDIEIDYHHTVEDTALVLGEAFRQALGDKRGIRRFGHAYVPLDESLARVVVDFSGRPFLGFEVPLDREMLLIHKDFPFALVEEFFKSFANACGCNVHIDLLRGRNGHHAAEAIFKAFAIAVRMAKEVVTDDIASTKGVL
jgi:histidinol-phosphate aminotransferase